MVYFLAAVAAIAGFLFGYDEGVIAVVRPSLDKDFPTGPLVAGFMTASVPLGALVGASVAGRIVDRFGRRRVLMAAAALFALGALIAAAISAIWMLVMARLILGLAIGVAAVGAPLYIAETAPLRIRGALVSTYQLAITIGILVSYLTGLLLAGDGTWRVMFGLGAVPGLLFLAGLAFLPESPRWLVLKGFPDAARASLRRLRAAGWDVDGELDEMVRTVAGQCRPQDRLQGVAGAGRPAGADRRRGAFLPAAAERHQCRDLLCAANLQPCRFRQREHADAGDGRGRNGQSADHRAGDVPDRQDRATSLADPGLCRHVGSDACHCARGHQPDAGAVLGHHGDAVALHRLFRHQPGTAAARHDVGGLSAQGAGAWHEHGIDQQLGLQLHRRLHLPVDAGRTGSCLHLHHLRRRLPGRNPLHGGAGAGNDRAFTRGHRNSLPRRPAPDQGA